MTWLVFLNVVYLVRLRHKGNLLAWCSPLGWLGGLERADWAGETGRSLEQLRSSWLVRTHLCFLGGADFDKQICSLDTESVILNKE